MNEMIGYCGSTCQSCQIYLATREKDEQKKYQMREEIAQYIKELYGQEIKPQDVSDCDGCKADHGRLFSGVDKCYMRKCARTKHIENCADCKEYPCEELEKLIAAEKDAGKD
jgi:hypothetical protein